MDFWTHLIRRECGWLGLVIIVGVLLCGCGKKQGGSRQQAGAGQPIPVTVAKVIETNVPLQMQSIGHVTAFSSVAVQSQVDGQLAKVHFKQGNKVKVGDLIAEIDVKPYQASLNQAQAIESRDAANQAVAALEENRNYVLFTNGIVSRDVYDQARATAQSLKAAVAADRAAVETARLQLSYCYILSPVDGRTGELLVTAGNIIKKQDTTIVIINQTAPIYADFTLPEKELSQVRRYFSQGQLAVQASPKNGPNSTGELLLIGNQVQTNTGNAFLRSVFPNSDEALWPGQFVDVKLTLTVQSNVLVVPSESIQAAQSGYSVFVVGTNDTALFRAVVLGQRAGGLTVVEKGVNANEMVVTTGQLRLSPGAKMQITPRRGGVPTALVGPGL